MMSWPSAGANAVRIELYKSLEIKKGVTAIIGSGGKTSLMLRLCRDLPGTVIVCTSTHIFPPEGLPLYTEALTAMPVPKLCVGTPAENGKLTAPVQSFEELAGLADYVLVEADGSKHLPLKAHLDHEPVIPACANQVIQVLGISGIGRPIREAAHRPALYAELAGTEQDAVVTVEIAAAVVGRENLHTKIYVNQLDAHPGMDEARRMAALLNCPVLAGSLWKGEYFVC